MHVEHQGLFTLWRRVKSFSQALGCRVIDFPDPESQKGFVYLPSLSLSPLHPRYLSPSPSPPTVWFLYLAPAPFTSLPSASAFLASAILFFHSPFQRLSDSSVCPSRSPAFCLFHSVSNSATEPTPFSATPVFTLECLFLRGVESSRVESSWVASGFVACWRYGRIVKIGHWPKTSIFRLFHRLRERGRSRKISTVSAGRAGRRWKETKGNRRTRGWGIRAGDKKKWKKRLENVFLRRNTSFWIGNRDAASESVSSSTKFLGK